MKKIGKSVKEALRENFVASRNRVSLNPGRALKIYRELQGLSQSELANKAGLKQATISALESGQITLGLERAKVLARALKVHPSTLAFPDWDVERESAA